MKTFYLSIITIVMLQTCLILTFHLVSAQTVPTIKPGFLPDCMGQSFQQNESFDIVNTTGFLEMHYLYYGHILVYDYILKPGQNATILYAEHGGSSSNIAGDFQFFHGNNDGSHSGVNIQETTINATDNSAYSKITIFTDQNAKQGTYWLIFPPGLCSGGSVVLLTIGDSVDLVPQIGTLKAHIENHETDDVVVINSSPYVLANLTLLDPAGKVERAYEIMVDPNGNSARWFTPTQNGNYTAILTSVIGNVTIPFTVSGVEESPPRVENSINLYDSPLKQFKSGISSNDVKCNNGLQLVIKTEDDSPTCVKPDTASILVERGWGTLHGVQAFFPFGNMKNSTPSGNNTLPASFMPCDTLYPQNYTGIPVLYMPTNSIAKICLKYSNLNNFPVAITQLGIFDPNNNYQRPQNVSVWSDFKNTTIPEGNFTAVYWIKTGNQTGFYGIGGLGCVGIPFAIGYDNNSKIVSKDFPFIGITVSCQAGVIYSEIDSTTGIGVKYIQYP